MSLASCEGALVLLWAEKEEKAVKAVEAEVVVGAALVVALPEVVMAVMVAVVMVSLVVVEVVVSYR